MAVKEITKDNFEQEVLESRVPVLVDFWAPWCGYCRRIGPAVEALEQENQGRLKVVKINVDEQPELEEQFEVMTIPNLLVFSGGKTSKALIAPATKRQIEEWLEAQGI